MRLLGCFSKNTIVIDESSIPSQTSSPPSSPRSEKTPTKGFVPASIPELHPEYAHAEPYCFAAKTDSARLLVDRARRARGQPPLDPAVQLRQQGHVVVRGPTYSLTTPHAPKPSLTPKPLEPEKLSTENLSTDAGNVPLHVETPATGGELGTDSDDLENENVNVGNVPRRSKASEKKTRSVKKEKKEKKEKTPPRRSAKPKQKDRVTRKSKASEISTDTSRKSAAFSRSSDMPDAHRSDISMHRRTAKPPRPDTAPRRTYSSSDHESEDTALQNAMGRAPAALLAPIMVPRMSNVFPERQIDMSPSVSVDSWAASDSAARFDDIEEEGSSGFIALAAVGKGRVIHKAETPTKSEAPVNDDIPLPESDEDALLRSTTSPKRSGGLRSKRKSKPFLQSISDFDAPAPELAPDSAYSAGVGDPDYTRLQDRDDDRDTDRLGPLKKASNARQISGGGLSDEIMQIDTSGDDLCDIPTPAVKAAAQQRVEHNDLASLPRADANKPQGIIRRASTGTKRKTVSFHDAAPVVIEPNLRAPSRSLPRDLMYSKDTSDEGEFHDALDGPSDSSFSALPTAHESVSPPPVTMELPRLATREFSDSTASEDNFVQRSSRRMSRVSIHDKTALREASKRQSQAVAKAMSEQIRGVPKSAMLAYSEHEVLVEDDPLDADEERSGHLSFRRRSRTAKSIRMPPTFVPGQVPPPPPPPPFQPETPRVRSVRKPPPPPSAYKKQS